MSLQDPIAAMLTSIRNGQTAKMSEVVTPLSKIKVAILEVLKNEGYIADYKVHEYDKKGILNIYLKYHNGLPVISKIQRVSRSGLRIYKALKALPEVLNGLGVAVISTSKGVMAAHDAKRLKLGGEILCVVY